MRIIYLLKKGLQCYPPCLCQVLLLNDLGAELVVYHGKNSSTINDLLKNRNIEHYEYTSDKDSRNKIESAFNFMRFLVEFRKRFNFANNDILWFGNVETILAANYLKLRKYKYVLSVLELYDEGTFYDWILKKVLKNATINLCCEKHRAAIMQSRYDLTETPFVFHNKPYDYINESIISDTNSRILYKYRDCFIVIYQGLIAKDRPLDKIAEALNTINDDKIVFLVLGKCSEDYRKSLRYIYKQTEFLGYVPAPEHLSITSMCHLGIANYNTQNLNNVFCAPNKIYEYAKYGLPMLCSRNIGLSETVGVYGAGECIDFSNLQETVCAIRKIKSNYEEYSRSALRLYKETNNIHVMKDIFQKLRDI